MKTIYVILLISGISSILLCQTQKNFIFPSPVIGWDSLSNLVQYPEIARRAGIQDAYYARLFIDTTGDIQRMAIFRISNSREKYDTSIITHAIYQALQNTKWNPATNNGQKTFCPITIPFLFLIAESDHAKPILKIVPKPLVQKTH